MEEQKINNAVEVCVCPECDYEEKHEKGNPCNEIKCPDCGAALQGRSGSSDKLDKKSGQLIEWNQKYINDLPDTSFALIKGKVKNKSKDRALPFKDLEGNVNSDQLKNSLARLPITKGFSDEEKKGAKEKLELAFKEIVSSESEEEKEKIKVEEKVEEEEEAEEPVEPVEPEKSKEKVEESATGVIKIQINGEIGWDVTGDMIKEQLEKANGADVLFEISSPGGSVFEGLTIFNAIRNYKGKTAAHIIGLAASMASYIPLATDSVKVEDNAIYMIHNAWTVAIGDVNEMQDKADFLGSLNSMLSKAYSDKTGNTKEEILKLMGEETWYFGDEIKEMGFADEVIVHSKSNDDDEETKEDKMTKAKLAVEAVFSKLEKEKLQEDIDKSKSLFASFKEKEKIKAEEKVEEEKEAEPAEKEKESEESETEEKEEKEDASESEEVDESTEDETEKETTEESEGSEESVEKLKTEVKSLEVAHTKLTEANGVIKHKEREILRLNKAVNEGKDITVQLTEELKDLKNKTDELSTIVAGFKKIEEDKNTAAFNEFVDEYCEVYNVDESDKSSIEKDLGAFSEMVIENIKKTMKQAKQAVMNEVVDDSQHSSELENSGVMSGSEGIPAKVLPVNKDSMDGLFDKLKIRTEIDEGRILIDPSKVEEFKHKN